ncbi:MAG: DUF362 domain-containing protein [Desulfobacula sp.]|jgi:uncharacterized protein (DUF362 family)/NAD-dependent dihydropyrimidine dehydrogenase PreA subunit|uniref:DUF362 domain-containing protein n=1 Tax=Desulfobacula sp. TaxID=2593537 RepID=UPI001DEA9E35|nr:DUF362 domain-containing protein [Desulfobacula sp.]MBT3483651.1 DUF362 domain-containing protein [Desulfobacula sp.]MBT3804932.1 DUF362 domain-containing protein [Desulfobacula sp.]MBT4023366.1 DUF362 domain-containing protein [Desulfobacula sp.]MBT4197352.1 DUF362 domain-containing protein [Desulfobacula sp.]
MSKVVLIRCESYEYDTVKTSIERGISLLGGISLFAKKGENILLKPNILVGDTPEKCVTTNPAVFKAVIEILISAGVNVTYGDSPAIGKTSKAAKKAGLARVADEFNIKLADFKTGIDVFFDKGIQNRRFTIAKAVFDADGVISLPKLKTHGLEKFTGAIKNQFGCVPGVLKGEFHLKLPGADDFAKMLVDLNKFVDPRLYIMDGIYGMEGNGPRGGTPKKMNILLLSSDPVALDAIVCRLIKLNPEYVPTIRYGYQAGMGSFLKDEIELMGDDFESFITEDFKINRKPIKSYKSGFLSGFMNNRLVSKPYIEKEKCVRCGVCVTLCPADPKAVFFKDNDKSIVPVYNYDNCIKCFCCQEICPESAIHLKTPILRKIINFI